MPSQRVILLGPQRHEPTLKSAIDSLGLSGPLAAVTAGWEEREGEDQELRDHLAGRVVNLRIWERAEEIYRRDPQLQRALREQHEFLRKLQELYRLRLSYELDGARELLRRPRPPGLESLFEAECSDAIESVRLLDRLHVARIAAVHAEFEERWRPAAREAVARQRDELRGLLGGCSALCVAGGHVIVLLNRMRLLGALELLGDKPIVAWSAGAMLLSERIVLFHDSPPQGAGNPEVLEAGLGAYRGVVALPHADKRLRLEDRTRVALFARRFHPDLCALLVPHARLDWDGERWSGEPGTRALDAQGHLTEVGPSRAA